MRRLIRSYEHDVHERRTALVDVFEDSASTVSAWHGGRQLTTFTTMTSEAAAIQEAEKLATHFCIERQSSVRLRVSTLVSHHAEERPPADFRLRSLPAPQVVSARHVWDSHAGTIAVTEAFASFETAVFVAFNGTGTDPGDGVREFVRNVSIDLSMDTGIAFAGFGFSQLTLAEIRRVEDGPSPPLARGDDVAHLVVTGRCRITAPVGSSRPTILSAFQDVEPRVDFDFNVPGTLHTKWSFFSNFAPAVWHVGDPGPAFPGPDRTEARA